MVNHSSGCISALEFRWSEMLLAGPFWDTASAQIGLGIFIKWYRPALKKDQPKYFTQPIFQCRNTSRTMVDQWFCKIIFLHQYMLPLGVCWYVSTYIYRTYLGIAKYIPKSCQNWITFWYIKNYLTKYPSQRYCTQAFPFPHHGLGTKKFTRLLTWILR